MPDLKTFVIILAVGLGLGAIGLLFPNAKGSGGSDGSGDSGGWFGDLFGGDSGSSGDSSSDGGGGDSS
ncbi:MAG TPA: hypothetical protein VHU15_08365 [Stellaceae bacterium]|jgi:hypothetical protein|nr:hypothetical protein [Stellaceae bacterium]